MKLLATWAAVAGIVSAHMPSIASSGIRSSKACHDLTFQIPVTARNGVFDNIATPKTNLEATTFGQAASQQGFNGTKEALTGYATISNTYSISATYCMPNSSSTTRGTVLQILTHGIGFDKSYWDLPYDGYNYSYVDIALEHGYHTLAYDRLGIGMSSHGEPKNEIQAFLEIETLAQMTKMAQNGSLSGISQKPGKIVHVGHSFGSSQTYAMTAKYPSISDGIVLTGFSMNSTFLPYFEAGANFQQAQLGTKSCQDNNSVSIHLQNYQLGYLTNGNIEANQYLFFYPPQFDVGILYFAEKARQPVTIGELLTLPSVPKMTSFKGPVLVIDGSNDLPYCGGDCSNTGGTAPSIPEMAKKSSPNASAFEAYLQPSTGHAINLHYNATGAYKFIINFLEAHSL